MNIERLENDLKRCREKSEGRKKHIKALEEKMKKLKLRVKEQTQALQEKNEQLGNDLDRCREKSKGQKNHIKVLEEKMKNLKLRVKEQTQALEEKNEELETEEQSILDLEFLLAERSEEVKKQTEVSKKNQEIENLECKIERLENYCEDLKSRSENKWPKKKRRPITNRKKQDWQKTPKELIDELCLMRKDNRSLLEGLGLMRFASKRGKPCVQFTWKGIEYEDQCMAEIGITKAQTAFRKFWQEDYSKRARMVGIYRNINPLYYLFQDDEFDIFRIGFHGGSWENNNPNGYRSNLHGFIDFQKTAQYYNFCTRLVDSYIFTSPFGFIEQNCNHGWVLPDDHVDYIYLLPVGVIEFTSQDARSSPLFLAFMSQLDTNLEIVQAVLEESKAIQWGVVFNKHARTVQTFIIIPEPTEENQIDVDIISSICGTDPEKKVNHIQSRKFLFHSDP